MTREEMIDEIQPTLDPGRALDEAQELAREILGAVKAEVVPNWNDVMQLCRLVAEFETVTTKRRS